MKAFFLVLALVAGGLSLLTTLGMMRVQTLTPLLALTGWFVALGLAGLAWYALRSAMRFRTDRFSLESEEERLRGLEHRYGQDLDRDGRIG